jgi:radical SAM protein with 4Fe4S-binding SPASM domain
MPAETVSEKLERISQKGYPTLATIEVTSRCNARCGYCYLKDCTFPDLSTERLYAAIDKLSKGGVFHMHVTGGEPFLRPDILDVLSFAYDHGIFMCTLFSNGILLNDEHLEFILRKRDFFRDIQMSVFSHVPEKNDRFFGVPGALDAIIKNALFLKENGVLVTLALSLLDFNVDEMEETLKFFKDLGLPPQLANFKIITSPRIEDLVAASTSYSFFKRFLSNLSPGERGKLKHDMKESLNQPPGSYIELCSGRWTTVFMNAQGDLAPCVTFRNMKFGNIFEEKSLHDILQTSRDYHAVCAMKKNTMKKCASCKFINFCTICPGSMHSEYGSLCIPSAQVCNYAHALFDVPD